MRNLMRRALDRLTGSAAQKSGDAGKSKARPAKPEEAPAQAASAEASGPTAAAPATAGRGRDKRAPSATGGRAALIENALAIQRDQARILDQLHPAERKRLQALARRTFAPVLKDDPAPERKPDAPAAAKPAKPTKPASPPGRRRP